MSRPEAPVAAISAAMRAGIPVDIDVEPVSMTWISRSGSAWAASVALPNVPESFVPITGQTTASAPSAKQASNVSLKVPGDGAAVFGKGAPGASSLVQNCSVDEVDPGLELLAAELDVERHDADASGDGDLGREVGGGIGDDGDA